MKLNLIKINIFILLICLSFGCNKEKHVSGTNYNLSMQIPKRVKNTSAKSNPLFQKEKLPPVIDIHASEDSYVKQNKDLKVIDENLQARIKRKVGSKIFVDKAAIDSFYVGQILLSDITDDAPYGYLVKVQSIEKDNAILNVKEATLDDAFDSAFVRMSNNECANVCSDNGGTWENHGDAVPDGADSEWNPYCRSISLDEYLPRRGVGQEVDFENGEESGSARWWFYTQPSANLIIAFDFIKNVPGKTDLVEVGVGLQLPKFGDCGSSEPDITMGFETMYNKTWRYNTPLRNLPRIRVWIGGVPITFKNKGGFGGTATIEGQMKASLNIDLFGTFMSGATVQKNANGDWGTPIIRNSEYFRNKYFFNAESSKPGWKIEDSGVYFGAALEVWPYVQIETRLWGTIGLIGKVGPSFDCSLDFCTSINNQNANVDVAYDIGIATEMSAVVFNWESGVRHDYFGPFPSLSGSLSIPIRSRTGSEDVGECEVYTADPIPEPQNGSGNNESKIGYEYAELGVKFDNNSRTEQPEFKSRGIFFHAEPVGEDNGHGFTFTRSGTRTNNKLYFSNNKFKFRSNNPAVFHLRHSSGDQYHIALDNPDGGGSPDYLRVTGSSINTYGVRTATKENASLFTITNLRHLTVLPINGEATYSPCPGAGKRDISEAEGTLGSSNSMANDIQDFLDILTNLELCDLRSRLIQNDLTDGQRRDFIGDFCSTIGSDHCYGHIGDLQKFNDNTSLVDAWEIPNRHRDDISKNVGFIEKLYADISNPEFPNGSSANANHLKAALDENSIFNFYKKFHNSSYISNTMRKRYLEAISLQETDRSIANRIAILESALELKEAISNLRGMTSTLRNRLRSKNVAYGEVSFRDENNSLVQFNFVSVSGYEPTITLIDGNVTNVMNKLIVPVAANSDNLRFFIPNQGRGQDSEAKIIEYIMNEVAFERGIDIGIPASDSNTIRDVLNGANLDIDIWSEMEACRSCANIIRAFNNVNTIDIDFLGGTKYYEQD